MTLVLPDNAELVWVVAGFVVFVLPLVVIASLAFVAMRRARSPDRELRRLNERVEVLEQRESATSD